jgi:hypothetical protein
MRPPRPVPRFLPRGTGEPCPSLVLEAARLAFAASARSAATRSCSAFLSSFGSFVPSAKSRFIRSGGVPNGFDGALTFGALNLECLFFFSLRLRLIRPRCLLGR